MVKTEHVKVVMAEDGKPYFLQYCLDLKVGDIVCEKLLCNKWMPLTIHTLNDIDNKTQMRIIALPEQIEDCRVLALASDGIDSGDYPSKEWETEIKMDNDLLKLFLNGDIDCYIEVIDEFTNPEEFRDVAWGEGIPKAKLENGKVIVHI